MSLNGFQRRAVQVPRGQWASLANRKQGVPSRASAMQNQRIRFGVTGSRPGTSKVITSGGQVTAIFNWIAPWGENFVFLQDGALVKAYSQDHATAATLASGLNTTRTSVFAPVDVWTYFCGYDVFGNGTYQTRIFDGTNTDVAFRGAPTITGWTAIDAGAGQCTSGQHFLGFVYQNRTGYQGIPVTSINYAVTATLNKTFAVAATSNANPDVLTVPGHTFVNGDKVTGAGSTGDTAINGVFMVTAVIAGVSLELTDLQGNLVPGNGAYTGGCVLTAPDLITAPGNNLTVGQQVTISGATGDTAINGTRLVATTPTPGSTFTLTDTDGNLINSNGAYSGNGVLNNPIQIKLTAGLRQVNISVTLPAELDGGASANGGIQATLFLIATRADNPALWYFIPNDAQTGQVGEQPVPFNTPATLNFIFSLSDEDIASQLAGDTAQKNFLLLAQDANGNGPFTPNFVVAYGQRMCYGAGTSLYVSDLSAPQQIAPDLNQIRMQNQRTIAYAFQLQGNTSLYLTGDKWTGYVTDNNDSPSTWGPPTGVSDAQGAAFPQLVCAQTGGNWAWIVTEAGVYLFDGAYQGMPLTYLSSGTDASGNKIGWSRVNWTAAFAIQIKDDVSDFKLYIAAPLDGDSEPNFIFCIDYRMGKTFDTCDISIDLFTPARFSAIGVVKEIATAKTNLWLGPSAAGNIIHFDESTHNDQGIPINNFWQSGLIFATDLGTSMLRIGYLDLWIRGHAPLDANGQALLGIAIRSIDGQNVINPEPQINMGVPAPITETPGQMYSAKIDVSKIPGFTIAFSTNSVDSFFELSGFNVYWKPDLSNR